MIEKRLINAVAIGAMAFASASLATASVQAAAEDTKPLVIVDSVGDRGMLAPFVHHRNGFAYVYTSYLFDALASQDKDGKIVPALANAWTISDDGLVCDITLNKNARWHDGEPVTSEDVVFSFTYHAEKAYHFLSLRTIAKVEAIAADKVRVTLKRPDAALEGSALISMPILPKHIYKDQPTPARFTDAKAAIGSGPYKLVKYDKAQGRYLLESNKDYCCGKPKFDQIVIAKMGPEAAIQAMKTGQVDIIGKLPYSKLPAAKKAGLNVLTNPGKHPIRLVFNHGGLFGDKSLRHGLAYAIDRQALVDVAYPKGAAVVAETGYFQKGTPWFSEQSDPGYAFDAEKAAGLLTKGGWTKDARGKWSLNGEPLKLRLIAEKRTKGLATALAEQLEAFGIGMEVRLLQRAAIVERAKKKQYDLALFTASSLGDPSGATRRVFGKVWRSDGYTPGEPMKMAMKAQASAVTKEERMKHLSKFQTLYAEELPSYILVDTLWTTVHSDRVTPFYMPNGIALGVPLALHKSILLQ